MEGRTAILAVAKPLLTCCKLQVIGLRGIFIAQRRGDAEEEELRKCQISYILLLRIATGGKEDGRAPFRSS